MDVLSYQLETAEQFWDELDDISSGVCQSNWTVGQALTTYLKFASLYMDQYLVKDEDLARCGSSLLKSNLFSKNRAYARRKLISVLTLDYDELDVHTKTLIGAVLLLDGRVHVSTFEMLQEEEASKTVIEALWHDRLASSRMHRVFLELLYEMCRVQKLRRADLDAIRPEFFDFMFGIIESNDNYDADPYSLAAMCVLLALNEQYMVASLSASGDDPPVRNYVFLVLQYHGDKYRTFGENLVFLFNRGTNPTLQIMMMKILYLIFTTHETFEYIYLNDLKVLVSVIIRELADLSWEDDKLRHTYLRVLHPLLQNTQLKQDQYRRDELIKVLVSLSTEDPSLSLSGTLRSMDLATPATQHQDQDTQRLSRRCLSVTWLNYTEPSSRASSISTSPLSLTPVTTVDSDSEAGHSTHSNGSTPDLSADNQRRGFSILPRRKKPPPPPRPNPRKLATMSIRNTSALDVASIRRPPSEPT